MLLSCKANFHVVRSALPEFDASTLYIFADQVFCRSYVLWYIPPLTVRRLAETFLESLFFVTSDFYFSVFRTACFSGGEKQRPETRQRSQATLQPWRDKTRLRSRLPNWRMLNKTTEGVSDLLEDNSMCWRTSISRGTQQLFSVKYLLGEANIASNCLFLEDN